MTTLQSVEDIADQADAQYCVGLHLKKMCRYERAFEYFKMASRKYESLANREDISDSRKLDYLGRQRKCLESMLVDAFSMNLELWASIMLKIKEIDDYRHSIN